MYFWNFGNLKYLNLYEFILSLILSLMPLPI